MLFQLADGHQAVNGVSGEAGHRLGHDQINFSVQSVRDHFIEAVAAACARAGHAFVPINGDFDTM